ncbi:restriction endonuclease subunit M [Photobacterium leiognathi]|uniref:restriction endonuclease subunit M n=1 Tax=Photobacterium leiognathi TaxID=553611 RepID=UPI002982A095|nr:N-6 DNA methylase [Photobacterium leiognathi]
MSDWQKLVRDKVNSSKNKVVSINLDNKTIEYSSDIVKPKIEHLHAEEIVRAYLVDRLVNKLGYSEKNIELEKIYTRGSIGREKQKNKDDSARVDIIVKDKLGNPFLFIELKAPDKFVDGEKDIKGQLFELSDLEEKQNKTKVKHLIYYSLDTSEELADRLYLIEKEDFPEYDVWLKNKDKTYGLEIPYNYGKPKLKIRVKQENDTALLSISEQKMSEIRKDIHNTLWSSGVEDNEAYIFLVKYLLTKIYDEDESPEGEMYQCQILDKDYEHQEEFFERINNCYKLALTNKLHYSEDDLKNVGNILTTDKVSIQSLYFLVKKLQDYSFAKSIKVQKKDILGQFFEETNRKKFKESEGQFFTTAHVVNFLIYALQIDKLAIDRFETDYTLPYIIDPSMGSGTFLIEAMKLITREFSKHEFKQITKTKREKLKKLFPEHKPNDWAEKYIYGIDNSYTLTVSTKVNMILHGDGSSNTYKDDGLESLQTYSKYSDSKLAHYEPAKKHYTKEKGNMAVNEQFDVVISNPPFSVNISESKEEVDKYFLFGSKKNSENLFLERYYQLLKEGGRLGVVLPESVFDTAENRYIRLFLFKYFKIKAVISLPAVTFEPFTSTKTSILLAQKKTQQEVDRWNETWDSYGKEWSRLKTRIKDYVLYYVDNKKLNKKWSDDVIKDIEENNSANILTNICRFLKDYIVDEDLDLDITDLLKKYLPEIELISKHEKETDIYGFYNAWWVFSEVSKEPEISYEMFMAEADNVGYKRTLKTESRRPNDLYDLEFAPQELDTAQVIKMYDDSIIESLKECELLEHKIKELNKKKLSKATEKEIEKTINNLKLLKEKVEQLNQEKELATSALDKYYDNNKLKPTYLDRDNEDLTSYFNGGIFNKYKSYDVVLRKNKVIKILDAVRKEVLWD